MLFLLIHGFIKGWIDDRRCESSTLQEYFDLDDLVSSSEMSLAP